MNLSIFTILGNKHQNFEIRCFNNYHPVHPYKNLELTTKVHNFIVLKLGSVNNSKSLV